MPHTGTLYLVATPIGNLSDITLRALDTLKSVDVIAAEDTRQSRKLLSHFNIQKPLVSYHEHNRAEMGEVLLNRLIAGENIALVTDAGTPAVSDPGEDLVRACLTRGVPCVPVPGACAAVVALCASGRSSRRFVFEGFLPRDKKERQKTLDALCREERTVILYEAPHRLKETLRVLSDTLGEREITLCRELTKLNEEFLSTTLKGALSLYEEKEPRGEYVILLEAKATTDTDAFWESLSVDEHYEVYLKQGYSKKEAIRQVAADRGVKKNEIYMHFVEKGS